MSRYNIEKKKWDEKSSQELKKRQSWKYVQNYDDVFSNRNILRPVYDYFTDIGSPGAMVLDYGCGSGWTALLLATKAEKVKAFDISHGRISILNKIVEHNNIKNLEAIVANSENLPYNDNTFDYVFGNAILHHLTLEKCLSEIARVLKPNGRAAFCEPFAHNPFINFYRYIKHHYAEHYLGTDRPLKYSDMPVFEKYFHKVAFKESSFMRDRFKLLIPAERFFLKSSLLNRYVCYVTVLLGKTNKNLS